MTSTTPDGEHLLTSPCLIRFPRLLGDEANRGLARLDRELDWQRPSLRLFGRDHPIPRRQVWMGDAAYRYSGRDFAPTPWHPVVRTIHEAVVARLASAGVAARFNSVLLNRYDGGTDRMGWHCDDEPELGEAPLIAAVSLGTERPLRFRWKDRRAPAFNVDLPHDSLLLMGAGTQEVLEHALLPRRLEGLRLSLTFRWVHP
ncbi:alpha-ketoglutarate-dependent dioxygenase AlkB [Halomonas organivorans]